MRNTRTGLSRRELGRLFAAGSLAGAPAAAASHLDRIPELDGTLHFDHATRVQYSADYGNIIHEMPAAVAKPGSVRDLSRMVRFAGDRRLRIAARGQGHLPFGQAQVRSGIVIDMRTLNDIDGVHGEEIHVDAGCTWTAVANTALERGMTPPVLTDYLGLKRRHSVSRRNFTGYLALRRTGGQRQGSRSGDRPRRPCACSENRNRETPGGSGPMRDRGEGHNPPPSSAGEGSKLRARLR